MRIALFAAFLTAAATASPDVGRNATDRSYSPHLAVMAGLDPVIHKAPEIVGSIPAMTRREGSHLAVMAGLDPAIYKTPGIAGSSPAMTRRAGLHPTGFRSSSAHEPDEAAGTSSPELMQRLERVAAERFRNGGLAEAEAARRQLLRLVIAAHGCGSPATAQAMTALAEIEIARQLYLDAEPLLIAARTILAEDDPHLAPVFVGLSRVAHARGDNPAAEQWARRAVAVGGATAGAALDALGTALAAEERIDEAESLLQQALRRASSEPGAPTLRKADALSQLGNFYLREHRFAEALPLIEEAAEIHQQRLGPTHPFIADDLYDVGLAYEGLKRGRDAERVFLMALHLLQRSKNLHTPRAAYIQIELARVFRSFGDEQDAKSAEGRAHDILQAADEAEHERERRT